MQITQDVALHPSGNSARARAADAHFSGHISQMISGAQSMGQAGAGFAEFMNRAANPRRNERDTEMLKAVGLQYSGPQNAMAREFRNNVAKYQNNAGGFNSTLDLPPGMISKSRIDMDAIARDLVAKSILDVGTITNLTQVVGGQALGLVSLDTHLARGTIRASSFTLYQALNKTQAFQPTDYWAYIDDTGGAAPGAAFGAFATYANGPLTPNVGNYIELEVTLAMLADMRALSIAVSAQANYVDLVSQESANAALNILSSVNWACYFGNSNLFPYQFNGLATTIPATAPNTLDFSTYFNTIGTLRGETPAQALYNAIYQAAADITGYNTFGRTTHAFMSPIVLANLSSLTTALLNNIVNGLTMSEKAGYIIDGDLRGMKTRMGVIQFVLDINISARNRMQAALPNASGVTRATTVNPTNPASVTVAAITGGGAAGSAWTSAYAGSYYYAVVSCDASMNESIPTYSALATGVVAGGAYTVTIAPPAANDAYAFRVFRSGLGGVASGVAATPLAYRVIGTIKANGTSNVVFTDLNTNIPGSHYIFLLDLDEGDNALDFRFMLPLTKVELFAAASLQMPWAITMIGALRNRIPKFHGLIKNFVADDPLWNPLSTN